MFNTYTYIISDFIVPVLITCKLIGSSAIKKRCSQSLTIMTQLAIDQLRENYRHQELLHQEDIFTKTLTRILSDVYISMKQRTILTNRITKTTPEYYRCYKNYFDTGSQYPNHHSFVYMYILNLHINN